jgi:hypothetical protein
VIFQKSDISLQQLIDVLKFGRFVKFTIFRVNITLFLSHKYLMFMNTLFNKYLYLGFIVIGMVQLFYVKDYLQAAMYWGIALAFDPFNVEQHWSARPLWQKVVLIVHLAIVAACFGYGIGIKDK